MAASRARNRLTALAAAAVVAGMVGLAFAAAPFYDAFCRLTGFGGTTQRAETAPGAAGERRVTVRFNADVARDMPWQFRPVEQQVEVRLGEERLAFFRAHNPTDRTIVGSATFNVTPDKAGRYFDKIACFCFEEQRLEPGQTVDMPVSFFVDPAILDDARTRDVDTITLSYTFFLTRIEPGRASAAAPAGAPHQLATLSNRE
jgi:cytochrome c oxidase assembly protein subunit 11